MAVINKICLSQNGCNTIIYTDISDWDGNDPFTFINNTDITLTKDGTTFSYSVAEYLDTITINAVDTPFINFIDGLYTLKVIYTSTEEDIYTIEEEFFNTCNIKCKLAKLINDIPADSCNSCKKEKLTLAAEASVLYKLLCSTAVCNTIQAEGILAWLEDKLINYNCKNC